MAFGRRGDSRFWMWEGGRLVLALAVFLLISGGCSEDCPVCPEPPVESQIVPYISYCDLTNRDLMCAKKIGDSWGTKLIESGYDVGRYTSIALDAHNNAHISYYQATSDNLHYAVETDDGWLTEVVDTDGNVGRRTSIAIDAQGNPHISYWNASRNVIRYARRIAGEWSTYDLDSPYPPVTEQAGSGDYGQSTSLVLDAGGTPHISYKSTVEGRCLVYAVKTGEEGGIPSWEFTVVDDGGNVGSGCSMALDSDGMPHISHSQVGGNVRYVRMGGDGEWRQPESVPGPLVNGGSYPTSLDLDAGDNPHIAYYTQEGSLGYVTKASSGGWLFEVVDGIGNVGADCSLAVDIEGNPHISYWDKSNNDLKYAVKRGGYWIIDTADPWGEKGQHTGIALGTQ